MTKAILPETDRRLNVLEWGAVCSFLARAGRVYDFSACADATGRVWVGEAHGIIFRTDPPAWRYGFVVWRDGRESRTERVLAGTLENATKRLMIELMKRHIEIEARRHQFTRTQRVGR